LSEDKFPSEVRDFILTNIDSIGLLEVLNLVFKKRDREWTSAQASQELRSSDQSTDRHLMKLQALRIVTKSTQSPPTFKYEPSDPKLASVLDGLIIAYTVFPIRVMELIYQKPSSVLRDFAEAFKIRKDPKDG
jgi:hypothetical protein